MKLLARDEFREGVFARDKHLCVICGLPAADAHHILERRLFTDGGYYLDNGASLCPKHHLLAESTELSCDEIRTKAGITKIIIPEHLYDDLNYDKWGNIILPTGERLRGELFDDLSVQKVIQPVLGDFSKYMKYPRTYHVPWSVMGKDDRQLKDDSCFDGQEVIGTVKMDGENCLDGETIIITEDGEKTIKEICETQYKGKTITFNELTSELEWKEIVNHMQVETNEDDEWFELEIENNTKLRITGEHYVFLPKLNCYRQVKDLSEEDEILLL